MNEGPPLLGLVVHRRDPKGAEMEYHELEAAVAQLNGDLATIEHRWAPGREFLAQLEYCAEQDGVGYVYLFWVDRRTVAAYAETLTRVEAADILALRRSGIPAEGCATAYLGDDWSTTLRDPEVFPQPPGPFQTIEPVASGTLSCPRPTVQQAGVVA